ncbi:MAG: DUF2806 domain-containing protein [Deltaproteobacteria bacterium]|nr:MAG: DUF2806 domain-containing protein [Deltaproteobacteria bacterium]
MSGPKFVLFDLGKSSKPLSKLVDAVSQGLGTLYEPTKIRRKAKALADASLIKAEGDIKKKELLRRAANRLAFQEISRQENIEHIIEIAAENLPDTVSEEPVDRDWISRFFDECKDVSHEDLQKLWARILANEVAIPKSCSRKTLSILKDISSNDAHIFNIFCSLLWLHDDDYFFPYKYDLDGNESQLVKYGLSQNKCLHLDNLGLIHCKNLFTPINSGDILNYYNRNHVCYTQSSNIEAEIYSYPLTLPGIELLSAINPEFNWEFYVHSSMLFSDDYGVFLACLI